MVTPKQWLPLPILLVAAVGFYMAGDLIDRDGGSHDAVVADSAPAPEKSALQLAAELPDEGPKGQASTAAKPPAPTRPSAKPVAVAVKATPAPKASTPPAVAAKPSAAPKASAPPPAPAKPVAGAQTTPPISPAVGNTRPNGRVIPASTPEQLAALAKASAGRIDPFVALEPPAVGAVEAPGITMTPPNVPGGKAPTPQRTPQPTPGDGMVVTGIITSPKESVAIVAAEGRSRLVQVGDMLPGGLKVVRIEPNGKNVIVSQGGRSARLAVKE